MVRTSSPRTLWPLGTIAAETNLMELDVMSSHFRKVKNQYSVFCHLLDTPDRKEDLASVALQSPVIYHATLYVATAQQSACAQSASNAKGIRSSLFHERVVLRFVQTAISTSKLPSEEIIFAAALLGISQGVAQMVRLRGGVNCMSMPVLFNLLEWDVAYHLQKFTKAFNPCSNNGVQARWGMLALTYWRPFDDEAIHDGVPQIDEAARLAGLLSYLLVYEGGYHDLLSELIIKRLQDECAKLRSESHILGLLCKACTNRLCLVLWTLYCGGVFATNEVRSWFTEQIGIVAGGTGKDWSRTNSILDKFVWDDKTCERPMKQRWRESLATAEVPTIYEV
ncbi:MAG: hypothetical protein LQ341_002617 [Variospora aurantia]|nr:MAG: hypothetical protein LQ341_002617 [Variospora aurantia]